MRNYTSIYRFIIPFCTFLFVASCFIGCNNSKPELAAPRPKLTDRERIKESKIQTCITYQSKLQSNGQFGDYVKNATDTYDTSGNCIAHVVFNNDGTIYENYRYTYNSSGNLESERFLDKKGQLLQTTTYIYNKNNYCTGAVRRSLWGEVDLTINHANNERGQHLKSDYLLGPNMLWKSETYDYDKLNRLIVKKTKVNSSRLEMLQANIDEHNLKTKNTLSFFSYYTYDSNNNLLTERNCDEKDSAFSHIRYEYDSRQILTGKQYLVSSDKNKARSTFLYDTLDNLRGEIIYNNKDVKVKNIKYIYVNFK
ncbi:MAG: hypothetical protein LWX56_08665 [Ignavibacteria bacterium]|nr:hypothetical protein [Ignavibacteria bacterium]